MTSKRRMDLPRGTRRLMASATDALGAVLCVGCACACGKQLEAGPKMPRLPKLCAIAQPQDAGELSSSSEGSTWINVRARFGSGRISRRDSRGWPAAFSSSSSESEEEEEDADESESESESLFVVSLPLDAESLLARPCSKTPRPRFICITRSSVSSMCSMSMVRGSLCSSSAFDCSIWGRKCWTRASTINTGCLGC